MTAKKKRTTKHVIGHILILIKKWQLASSNGVSRPFVEGVVFSNEGAKGRTPLFDASNSKTGDIFAYWKDEKSGILEISAPEPGYEIKAPKSMDCYFYKTIFCNYGTEEKFITYLDVTHLDVSKSTDFSDCFKEFGGNQEAEIYGLSAWDVSHGINFSRMFDDAFSENKTVDLDLTSWKFCQDHEIKMNGMFRGFARKAEEVNLNLGGWNVGKVTGFYEAFKDFACIAEKVNITGVDEWTVGQGNYVSFSSMFENFAPKCNCQLDLSKWSKSGALSGRNYYFALGTFFKIKEPVWADRED